MKRFDYYCVVIACALLWVFLLYIKEKELAYAFFGILSAFFGALLYAPEKKTPSVQERIRRERID